MAAALTPQRPPAGSLWEKICSEFEAQRPPHPDSPVRKPELLLPPPSTPLSLSAPCEAESGLSEEESELIFTEPSLPQETPIPSVATPVETPDLKTCSPREFLEFFIFPVLLPGMAELLHQAKKEKCFERKRTKFIALDFLTEWLYNHNHTREEEPFVEFFEIPFVKEWLKDHPRPPIPLSLLLTEEEATNIIQAFWRGYRIRCEPEVQELRQWQKHLRETKNIIKRVREFWRKQEKKVGTKMEDSAQPSPDRSKVTIAVPLPAPANVKVQGTEAEIKEDKEAELEVKDEKKAETEKKGDGGQQLQ